MRKLILLAALAMSLSSCSFFHVHKVEVEQGNYMTSAMVNRLHPGMTEGQVKAIMGEPILVNIINPRVISYVYTSQLGSNPRVEKKLTLIFRQGILADIQRQGI